MRNGFQKKGPIIIFTSRFVPSSRLPTYLAAGTLHMNFWQFSAYFGLAAILWIPLLVGLSSWLGTAVYNYFWAYQRYAIIIFVGVALFLWLTIKLIIPLFSFKGASLAFIVLAPKNALGVLVTMDFLSPDFFVRDLSRLKI